MSKSLNGNLDQVKHILINCPSWIGDAVMSLPALTTIRQNFPHAKIILLANSWVSGLYSTLSFIDRIILYNPKGADQGPTGFIRTIGKLRHLKADLAIMLQNAFRPAFMTWLAGIPHRWGYATDGRSFLLNKAIAVNSQMLHCHQILYYLQLLEKLGLKTGEPNMEINLNQQLQKSAHQLLTNKGLDSKKIIVGIHPAAAYGEAKRWHPERYAKLADRLINEKNLQVIIFGTKEDLSIVEKIVTQMNNKPFVLAGQTNLEELLGIINCCNIFIANDSGPMHLAVALGVPVIAIFGPTDEELTAPLGKQHSVIKKPTPCSPCSYRICPSDHSCMAAITVDEVYQEAIKKIGIRQS